MNNEFKISKDTEIEDLVRILPDSVVYLMNKNIRCLRCGEPIWGTIESAAKEKGFSDVDVEMFVYDLNKILNSQKKENK